MEKMLAIKQARNDALKKQKEMLLQQLDEQERARPKVSELLKLCYDREAELKRLREENKTLKGKEEKLKAEQEAKLVFRPPLI